MYQALTVKTVKVEKDASFKMTLVNVGLFYHVYMQNKIKILTVTFEHQLGCKL